MISAEPVNPGFYSLVDAMFDNLKLDIHKIPANAVPRKSIHPEYYTNKWPCIPAMEDDLAEWRKTGWNSRPRYPYKLPERYQNNGRF